MTTTDIFYTGIGLIAVVAFIAVSYNVITWLIHKWQVRSAGKKIAKHTLEEIDKMDGYEFEAYLEWFFRYLGYQVQNTPDSGDFGADLLVRNEDGLTVIQAKNYKNNVGIEAVYQAFLGLAYWASKLGGERKQWHSVVITNSYYTSSAKEAAKAINSVEWLPDIQLLDRNWLSEKLQEMGVKYSETH